MTLTHQSLQDTESLHLLCHAQEACLQMLIQHNVIDIFRYNVLTDELHVMRNEGKGEILNIVKDHYLGVDRPWTLENNSHLRLTGLFSALINNDPSTPDEGTMELTMLDGIAHLVCHYEAIRDMNGRLHYVIGQMEDLNLAHSRMLKTIEQQNEYISVLNALTNTYVTVIHVNLLDFSYKLLQGSPEVTKITENYTHIKDLVRLMSEMMNDAKECERFRDILNPYTISGRLMDKQFFTAEFCTKHIGWIRLRVLPSQYDNEGRVTHLILTSECIDAERRETVYLKQLSETDMLTGLYNRQAGERIINERIRNHTHYLFGIFDCDRFKAINDTFGHMVGDKLIIAIAKVFRETFPGQTCMRLGGDEFVLLITGDEVRRSISSVNGGTDLLKRFKENISKISIPEIIDLNCTVSAGVVISDGSSQQSFETLYHKADEALYASKRVRNGYITYAKTSGYR